MHQGHGPCSRCCGFRSSFTALRLLIVSTLLGGPGRLRSCYLPFMRRVLYPTELRVLVVEPRRLELRFATLQAWCPPFRTMAPSGGFSGIRADRVRRVAEDNLSTVVSILILPHGGVRFRDAATSIRLAPVLLIGADGGGRTRIIYVEGRGR